MADELGDQIGKFDDHSNAFGVPSDEQRQQQRLIKSLRAANADLKATNARLATINERLEADLHAAIDDRDRYLGQLLAWRTTPAA